MSSKVLGGQDRTSKLSPQRQRRIPKLKQIEYIPTRGKCWTQIWNNFV